MSIKKIQTLSVNPHFVGRVIQCFLTGYGKPCELNVVFFVAPIIFYKHSRDKLATANVKSKMETIFEDAMVTEGGVKLSGRARLAGFLERYEVLKECTKKAIIILSSERRIAWHGTIELVEELHYSEFDGEMKKWMKSSYYLGKIFAKATEVQINYYLGIEV